MSEIKEIDDLFAKIFPDIQKDGEEMMQLITGLVLIKITLMTDEQFKQWMDDLFPQMDDGVHKC